MGSVIMPNPGVSALDHTISSAAPKVQKTLQLQETNGLFGNPGASDPLRSALNPGAPNINPSNTLEAIDALLLGFTPTSSVVPAPPVGGSASAGALFSVGTAAGLANPTVNLLA
jgi:hypothetical protein